MTYVPLGATKLLYCYKLPKNSGKWRIFGQSTVAPKFFQDQVCKIWRRVWC